MNPRKLLIKYLFQMKKIFATLFGLFYVISIFAQTDAGLKGLLTPTGEVKFPMSIKEVSKKLNSKAIIIVDTTMGDRCKWELKTGLIVDTQQDDDNTLNFLYFQSNSNKVITGLPYNLSLHKSTLVECVTQFKAYKPKKTKLSATEGDISYTLLFKKGKNYVLLSFDKNNKLADMRVSAFDPNAAG